MDKSELLIELDIYFTARSSEVLENTLGPNINVYHLQAALVRLNNVAQTHDIAFYVYKEGQGVLEKAYYAGDPLNHILTMKITDYINITNNWIGIVRFTKRPRAICKIIRDPLVGEEWILVTETAPNTYIVADIVGSFDI